MTKPKTLIIQQLIREPQVGPEDKLIFERGVNVITGRANTGKTRWLGMLDYLFGESGQPEDAFGRDLSEKYDSIRALIAIGDEEFLLERRWKAYGLKTKVLIDDEPIDTDEFSAFLLRKLAIPILSFAKGSPYAERQWPELSWRILLRHIYRQQRFWSDIADKQPESEQHASLMQFLGIAENLFSERYGELVRVRKKIWKHEGEKESFLSILERISSEIVREKEVQVVLTVSSVDAAVRRLRSEIDELQQRRQAALIELRDKTVRREEAADGDAKLQSEFERLGETWVELQSRKEDNLVLMAKSERRVEELLQYRTAIENERSRMERARSAGQVLADLRVTHCPVCDQPVKRSSREPGSCFLCGQTLEARGDELEVEHERFDLEMGRLQVAALAD